MRIDSNILIVTLVVVLGVVCITAMVCSYMYFSNKDAKAKFSINAKEKSISLDTESCSTIKRYKKK